MLTWNENNPISPRHLWKSKQGSCSSHSIYYNITLSNNKWFWFQFSKLNWVLDHCIVSVTKIFKLMFSFSNICVTKLKNNVHVFPKCNWCNILHYFYLWCVSASYFRDRTAEGTLCMQLHQHQLKFDFNEMFDALCYFEEVNLIWNVKTQNTSRTIWLFFATTVSSMFTFVYERVAILLR